MWCAELKVGDNPMRRMPFARTVLCALALLALRVSAGYAEPFAAQDREDIVRLRVARGGSAQDVAGLLDQAGKAADRGLPAELLANKIKEGLAKGVEPTRIEPVLGRLIGHLDSAQEVLKGAGSREVAEVTGVARTRTLDLLAEAFARGLSPDEARELERQTRQVGAAKLSAEALAAGAKGLAVMKEAGIPVKEGLPVVSEAIQRGFRAGELVDLSRELKRRGSDIQSGKVRLQTVRDAIARGDRPDQLFADDRGDRGGRSGGSGSGHGGGEERIERRSDQGHGEGRSDDGRSGRSDSRPDRQDRSRSGR